LELENKPEALFLLFSFNETFRELYGREPPE